MKLLKNIAITVFMTASLLTVSSTTFAAEEKKIKVPPFRKLLKIPKQQCWKQKLYWRKVANPSKF